MGMKKHFLVWVILLTFASRSYSQIINQDASGTSSIVALGSTVSLNITEAQIQATHYGLFKPHKVSTAAWLYGFDIKAKNQKGISTLFDDSKITPGGKLAVFIGHRSTRFFYPATATDDMEKEELKTDLHRRVGHNYLNLVKSKVEASTLPTTDQKTLIGELQGLDKKGLDLLYESLTVFKSTVTDTTKLSEIKVITSTLLAWVNSNRDIQQFKILNSPTEKKLPKGFIPNKTTYWYLRGGFGATEFSYDQGSSYSDYAKRFMDTTAVSYYGELGYNLQYGDGILGINLGYAHQSNMDLLTTADYTYNYQDTSIISGKLTKQKGFTAYSGTYGFYGNIYINIDYQYLFALDTDTKKYLSAGPYLRINNLILAHNLAKNSTVFGISANYIDVKAGKFLGGIYLQSSDIRGQTQPKFMKSIQFGLIAKFSLSSIAIH
jgi:hypothetical protein